MYRVTTPGSQIIKSHLPLRKIKPRRILQGCANCGTEAICYVCQTCGDYFCRECMAGDEICKGCESLAWVIARDKQSMYVDRKQADVLKAAREGC